MDCRPVPDRRIGSLNTADNRSGSACRLVEPRITDAVVCLPDILALRRSGSLPDADRQPAAHHHGLELLGSHHCANTGAGRDPFFGVHDGGDERPVLACLPDTGDLSIPPMKRLQVVIGLVGVFSPQVPGIVEGDLPLVHLQIHRSVRHARQKIAS